MVFSPVVAVVMLESSYIYNNISSSYIYSNISSSYTYAEQYNRQINKLIIIIIIIFLHG